MRFLQLSTKVWRLQAALGEQTEITKFSQREYERLKNEKVLCRVCFEREISLVFLPCRHRVLCSLLGCMENVQHTGLDRMKIINTVPKSIPAPHKVDLNNPEMSIVVIRSLSLP